jgi:hypothetical protein
VNRSRIAETFVGVGATLFGQSPHSGAAMLKLRELERMASSIDHLTACCPLLLVVVLLLLHPEHSKPKSSPAAAVTSDVINDHHIQYIIFITLYLLPLLEIVGTHQIISKMAPKVLVVLTSQDKIPSNGHPTGWYLVCLSAPTEQRRKMTDLRSPNSLTHGKCCTTRPSWSSPLPREVKPR